MKRTLNKEYIEALHDVSKAESGGISVGEKELAKIRSLLRKNGLDEWLKSNAPL
jgi:hypothetical protein